MTPPPPPVREENKERERERVMNHLSVGLDFGLVLWGFNFFLILIL